MKEVAQTQLNTEVEDKLQPEVATDDDEMDKETVAPLDLSGVVITMTHSDEMAWDSGAESISTTCRKSIDSILGFHAVSM